MHLKQLKPITPGTRHQIVVSKKLLSKEKPIKSLFKRLVNNGGRNKYGRITLRHRKSYYRHKTRKLPTLSNDTGIITRNEQLARQSNFIATFFSFKTKKFSYIPLIRNTRIGTLVHFTSKPIEVRLGYRLPLLCITTGSQISNIGNSKIIFAKAAGTTSQLLQKGPNVTKVRLPSGTIKNVKSIFSATIGSNANDKHRLQILGKAGKSRLRGFKPRVRGVAMNPVDHPHGGGGGKPSVTPWGKPTKGKPTKKKWHAQNGN